MEVKRKKIKDSTLFVHKEAECMKRCTSLNDTLQIVEDMNLLYIQQISRKLQESKIQERIDLEIRMREGAYKLLVASRRKEQVLNASKNLLTCNTRIKAYMAELHTKKEEQDLRGSSKSGPSDPASNNRLACKGKVALSGLRVPLMWKDTDHFNNRGSSRRVAVFCIMRIGAEVFDTEMVIVDKSLTDICFEGLTVFNEAGPHFELTLELYSCSLEEETALVNTPKKLAKRLRNSLGKTSGKKFVETGDADSFLQYNPIPPDARYNLLAYTSLGLAQAEGGFLSRSLMVMQNVDSSSWLPLYGNLCCRLVAQPDCMTQPAMTGFLSQQQNVDGAMRCCSFYCVLKAGCLACFYTPEEIDAKLEPALVIPINKETRVRLVDKEVQKRPGRLVIINPMTGEADTRVFTAESVDKLDEWLQAFWQHCYDQDQWQHCCNKLLEIDVTSHKKPPLFLTKRAESVYNDLSIGSPGKFESLTDIIHNKIEETGGRFLISQEEDKEPPHWAALFDGSRPMVVQKSVVSPMKDSGHSSPRSNITKKRRAPLPPPGMAPYTSGTCDLEKENSCRRPGTRTGRPSLDAKFATIIQQLQKSTQKNTTPARNMAPLGHIGVTKLESGEQVPQRPTGPIPAPRHKLKSFRERINPIANRRETDQPATLARPI